MIGEIRIQGIPVNEILALAGKDEIHVLRGRYRGLCRDDILTAFGLLLRKGGNELIPAEFCFGNLLLGDRRG